MLLVGPTPLIKLYPRPALLSPEYTIVTEFLVPFTGKLLKLPTYHAGSKGREPGGFPV